MKIPTKTITDTNLQLAGDYLHKQFETRSWWPKAQPRLAKQEFSLMRGSAGALNVWCERWLNSSQLRKLERQIQKPS